MYKILLTLLILSWSSTTYASDVEKGGDRIGNGGDVVVCGNKVELLDIYEARLNGYKFITPSGGNYREMLESVLKNSLAPAQPKRAQRYLGHLKTFESESSFLAGIQLNDIDDSGMVAIPNGCKLKQIAIQISDDQRPPGKKRYTISLDLWNKLDEFNKMSLVLHEIVYREAIEFEKSNSLIVRAMVGELIRDEINFSDYLVLDWAFSKTIEYRIFSINEFKIQPEISFYKNEFNEDVFEISSKETFMVNSARKKYSLNNFSFRINDNKVLKGIYNKASDAYIVAYLLRPNTETFLRSDVSMVSSKEVEYISYSFYSSESYDLQVKFINTPTSSSFQLNFKDVTELNYGIYTKNDFDGKFSLKYANLNFSSKGENYIVINPENGEVLTYISEFGKSVIENEHGTFNCKQYYKTNVEGMNSFKYSFEKCESEETEFEVLISDKIVPAKLVSFSEAFFIMNGYLISSDQVEVMFTERVRLGIDIDEKIVFLEPGNYKYSSNQYNYFTIWDSEGKTYRVRNGEVEYQ